MKNLIKLLFFITVSLLVISPVTVQSKTKTFVAFSMKVAKERIEETKRKDIKFRQKLPEVYYLGGISRPWAVVIDRNMGDFILVGERDMELPELTMDDWVVALKTRFIHCEEDPGVTIDPRGEARNAIIQDVKYFGGVDATPFGQTCFEADWLMKKIGMNKENVDVSGLRTYYDLSVAQARNRGIKGQRTGSRFWFYPIVNRVNVAESMISLEKFQLGVFTELLYAEVDGHPVEDLEKFEHYPSEGFSRSFSQRYDALARSREVLEKLRSLTKLAALAKGLVQTEKKPSMDYWLKDYNVKSIETKKEVEVLEAENQEVGIKISGGVELAALALRIKRGEKAAFAETVLKTRPSNRSLTWSFSWTGEVILIRPVTADMSQIAELFAQALFLQKNKRHDAAIDTYRKIIEIKPDWSWPYNNRGAAYHDKGLYEQAISDYNKALEINPMLAEVYYNRGNSHYHKAQNNLSISDYDHALKVNPLFVEAWTNKGIVLRKLGRHKEAIFCYDRALEINLKSMNAWNNKGIILDNLGKFEDAIKCYDQAIGINPMDAVVWNNKGLSLINLKNYLQAIECFNRALQINGQLAEAWNHRGLAYDYLGRSEEAIEYFNKALEISPKDAGTLTNKGIALFNLKRLHEAVDFFNKSLEIDSKYVKAWINKGAALIELGNYEAALNASDNAIRISPKDSEALGNKGVALDYLGRSKEAIKYFNDSLEINPKNAKIWANKGAAFATLGRYQEAMSCYERAIDIDQDLAEAWSGKGTVLYALRQYEEALIYLNKAMEINPADAVIWYNKGNILYYLGRYEEAKKCWEKTIEIDPHSKAGRNASEYIIFLLGGK